MSKKKKRGKKKNQQPRQPGKKKQPQALKFKSFGEIEATAKKPEKNLAKLNQQKSTADFSKAIEKPVTIAAYLGEMLLFGIMLSLLPFGLISLVCEISPAANASLDSFMTNSPNATGACLIGIILASCLAYAYIHHLIRLYLKSHGYKSFFFEVT